jgi:hypothetical protein
VEQHMQHSGKAAVFSHLLIFRMHPTIGKGMQS